MALIIPTSYSTYGDATSLPGGPLSPYVLAQVPGDTELDWLRDLRTWAVLDEIKWKSFQVRREILQAKRDTWRKICATMKAATIVIIKPSEVVGEWKSWLDSQQAEAGQDYDRQGLIDTCSMTLIADTPIAYLPNRLSQSLDLYSPAMYLSFAAFAPERILTRIGGGLRDAKVFAARAHAMFDARHLDSIHDRTTDAFALSRRQPVLQEILATQRTFDEEHPRSARVLNEASEMIVEVLSDALLMPSEVAQQPLVQEYDSKDVDQLQAADVAAGWAHELLALGDERALLERFGRVILNGRRLT